jgi:peptide/nickel transport system permease protein
VLFYFVLKDHMSWGLLALMMACLGWSYDARLIRSVALSLRIVSSPRPASSPA